MATEKEEKVCWQCSEFVNMFPTIMCTIKDIKEKRRRTDEENIWENMVTTGNTETTGKENINNILEYASNLGYVKKSFYKNHNTYNINTDIGNAKKCILCSESIVPFNFDMYSIKLTDTYVDIQTFEQLASDVNELKMFVRETVDFIKKSVEHENSSHFDSLNKEITELKNQLVDKDNKYETLSEKITILKSEINSISNNNHTSWQTVSKRSYVPRIYTQDNRIKEIPLTNRFNGLINEENCDFDTFNRIHYNDDANVITNNFNNSKNTFSGLNVGESNNSRKENTSCVSKDTRRPSVVVQNVNNNNNNNFVPRPRTVPGNSTYANITNKGKKTLVIGASMINYIDIKEFNHFVENGYAIKRSYSGSTTSDLSWHIIPALIEQQPDSVIINIGTNNLTKKRKQTEEEICNDIYKLVDQCRSYGVNDIYISGLTCRPNFQNKINTINSILQRNANNHGFSFIDNTNITRNMLWKDNLHLTEKGTILLARNFLNKLNFKSVKSVYDNYY